MLKDTSPRTFTRKNAIDRATTYSHYFDVLYDPLIYITFFVPLLGNLNLIKNGLNLKIKIKVER